MARGFNTTLGSGTTDIITTSAVGDATTRSFAFYVYPRASAAYAARIFDHNQVGQVLAYMNSSTTVVTFQRLFSTTNGVWTFGVTASQWNHVVITYDSSSTANVPVAYVDGSAVSVTTATAPVGTATAITSFGIYLGNTSTVNRCLDGSLAEMGFWNVILDASEAAALGKGVSPALIRPQSLVEYVPLLRDNVSRKLAAPTVTGTAVQPHPRVIYPANPWVIVAPSAAAAATPTRMLMGVGR